MDCLKIKFLNKKVDPMKIQEQQVGLLKGLSINVIYYQLT